MPNNNGKSKRMGKGSKNRSNKRSNISSAALDIGLVGTRGDDHVVLSDLTYRPVPPTYNSKPPRQLLNQVFFSRQTTAAVITPGASAVEANIAFSAAVDMEQYTSYLNIFDQYYLHSAVITLTNELNSNSNTSFPVVHTAIDFNSVDNLGSIAGIESYGTHNVDVLTPGKSVTRIIMPCVGTTTNSAPLVTRMWVNSSNTTLPFFGFRSITEANGFGVINVAISCIWAYRNTI